MGWIIAAVVILLFGRNLNLSAITSGITSGASNFLQNAKPNPGGLPASTIQDTNNSPANQPSPWTNICNGSTPPSPSLPMNSSAIVTATRGGFVHPLGQ